MSKKIRVKVDKEIYNEADFLKDCPGYTFTPVVLDSVKRIIAIGDIHGDLHLAIKSFKLAKLINDKMEWIANPPNTVVVQVGDQIDSCRPIAGVYDCKNTAQPGDKAEDMDVMHFFNRIDKLAREKGGAVYSLLGNHELANSQGKFGYVSYKNLHEFKYTDGENKYQGCTGRQQAFMPGGPVAKMMACTRLSVLIIGSNMFVHAGVLPKLVNSLEHLHLDNETKLKYLNAIVRKWLLNKLDEKDIANKNMFIEDQRISPFWTRIYGSIPKNTDIKTGQCSASVLNILNVYKIGHLIVGHTPQLYTAGEGINGTCFDTLTQENKLFRVDGGFSRAFRIFGDHNLVQVLEIIDDNKFKILSDKDYEYSSKQEIIPSLNYSPEMLSKVAAIFAQNRVKPKRRNSKDTSYSSDINDEKLI